MARAISVDRSFFVISKTDPNFEHIRVHIDNLLQEFTESAKLKADKGISSAQIAINQMKDWHVNETASSQYNSALKAIDEAREKFQSASYFSYLDAQQLAEEAEKTANTAINIQKASMKKIIDAFTRLSAEQKWDFEKYEVKRYAPTELQTVLEYAEKGEKCAELETYASYRQAQSFLRESVKAGWPPLEKSIKAQERKAVRQATKVRIGTIVVVAIVASTVISLIPLLILSLLGDWLKGIFFWFVMFIIAVLVLYGVVSDINEQKIRKQYEDLHIYLKNKYSSP